jgi:putative two-component system hydrogenase maturation factor HypX/HoxX
MDILLISSVANSLSVRTLIELRERGHTVHLAVVSNEKEIESCVRARNPGLIICPYLLLRIPESVWRQYRSIIIHPGPPGDRGPSSLDWAILRCKKEWGVTAFEAGEVFDAGRIWAYRMFPMRETHKTTLYRAEVTKAAIEVILEVVKKIKAKHFSPTPQTSLPREAIRVFPKMSQAERIIRWEQDPAESVLRRLRASDTQPGVYDSMFGGVYLYGGHPESVIGGRPGEVLQFRDGAMCVGTTDGAVWITHVKKSESNTLLPHCPSIKLPAYTVLGNCAPHVKRATTVGLPEKNTATFQEIWYEEENEVGYLYFDFYNGAMSTHQAGRLLTAYLKACARKIKVLVLMGGSNFWSNGIHLHLIEASAEPAKEAMLNLRAINELVRAIITTRSKLVIASLWGSAGAGGAIIPLAADRIVASRRSVLYPYYKEMALYGSEYWTYLLPKRVGQKKADDLMETGFPLGADEALRIGYIDQIFSEGEKAYMDEVKIFAQKAAGCEAYAKLIEQKNAERDEDELLKPLLQYNKEETERMALNFSGQQDLDGMTFPDARKNFVYKRSYSRVQVVPSPNPLFENSIHKILQKGKHDGERSDDNYHFEPKNS